MSRSPSSSARSWPSRVVSRSPARRAGRRRRRQRVEVEGVQRLAELEHHVVGHVDGQRDRAHAGQASRRCSHSGEPPPGRGPGRRGRRSGRSRRVLEAHGVAVRRRPGASTQAGVVSGQPRRPSPSRAGHARAPTGLVGRGRASPAMTEHLVSAGCEQRDDVRRPAGVGRQHRGCRRSSSGKAELGRAEQIIPSGGVAVGLARVAIAEVRPGGPAPGRRRAIAVGRARSSSRRRRDLVLRSAMLDVAEPDRLLERRSAPRRRAPRPTTTPVTSWPSRGPARPPSRRGPALAAISSAGASRPGTRLRSHEHGDAHVRPPVRGRG
jgi:hypothetical protein